MKKTIIYFAFFGLIQNFVFSQEFSPNNFSGTVSPPTNGVTSCATLPSPLPSAAPNAITFNVSGVGVLNSTNNTLYRVDIDLNFDFGCGSYTSAQKPNQDDDLQLLLVAPDGTCAMIYNADWAAAGGNFSYGLSHNQIVGLSSVGCNLQSPNGEVITTTSVNFNPNTNSNFGVFASVDNLISTFNGVNADGTWTILLDNTSTNRPFCISSVNTKLLFASNVIQNEIGNGDHCVSAIQWDGQPTCITTTGQPSSSNLPGWNGGPNGTSSNFSNFNGTTCLWNADNNNSTWIEFTPTTTDEICISLSGIVNGQSQQSIIVTDSNNDGDNDPCTGTTGTYWDIVSCPNGSIYNGTAGTTNNQNHCFTPNPNQTYYLVIDGSAGAQSDIFISGTNIETVALPSEMVHFKADCDNNQINIQWATNSEYNTSQFVIQRSLDALVWETIGNVTAQGNSTNLYTYNFVDQNPKSTINYYRLMQVDLDGSFEYSNVISSTCEKGFDIIVYPNPVGSEILTISLNEFCRNSTLEIIALDGKLVYFMDLTQMQDNIISLDLKDLLSSGVYIVKVKCDNQIAKKKIVVKS